MIPTVFRTFNATLQKFILSNSWFISRETQNLEYLRAILVSIIDVTIALKPVTWNKLAHNHVSIDTRRNKIYSVV